MIVVNKFLIFTLIASTLFVIQQANSADTIFDKRFERWKKQAEAGDKRAQYKLGNAYLRGNGVKLDMKQAINWFTKSANQNYIKAAHKLGHIYYSSKNSRKYKLGFQWFLKAANKKYAPSQYYLGRMYFEGKGVKRDLDRALLWAKRAEQQQLIKAKILITEIHEAMGRVAKKRVASNPPPAPKIKTQPTPEPRIPTKITSKNTDDHEPPTTITPKETRPPVQMNTPLFGTRKIVTSGNWILNGKPAEHMPSILTKCESTGAEVKCNTDRLKGENVAYSAHYEVESVFSAFNSKGTFNAKYRINYLFVLPEDPDDPEPDEDLPALGWQKSYTKLRCRVLGNDKIHCFTDDFKVERFTK